MLIIDDENDIRTIASMALTRANGWEVRSAPGGAAGIAIAEAWRPDAILLDAMMPDMDGLATLRVLRERPATQGIPVLFFTAGVQTSERQALIEAGAAGVLAKPFDAMTLPTAVALALGWSGMTNDDEFAAEIARVWDASKGTMHARLDAVDAAGAALLAGSLDDERRAAAIAAAHKLAGSLGTFGLPEGSALAAELDMMLRAPGIPPVLRLSELAERLRALVHAGPPGSVTAAVAPDPIRTQPVADTPKDERGLAPVDVVMIDDDVVLAQLVRHALEIRGYSMTGIGDGKVAVDALIGPAALRCRLLLLDVDLPGLDGFSVLRRLAAAGVTRTTPTIMLTVRASETEVLEALRAGAVDHVTKPFSMPILLQRIRLALER